MARFLSLARLTFVISSLGFVALFARRGRPGWLLAAVLAANAFAWGVTNYPLQRLYALGPSHDRTTNLALVQVVAAGNSPLHTAQVGQLHFEPFWGFVVAALSGWSTDRVLSLYPFLPLAAVSGFVLSLFFALRPVAPPGGGADSPLPTPPVDGPVEPAWSAWERACIALFATLLCSLPLDFAGSYRAPWAMTFLLKPNHALGLVLFPWVLRAVAGIRGWRGRLGAGLLLHLLGWAFIIHMVYVCVGLVLFAAHSLLTRRQEARRDVLDVAVVIGVNLLVVSPYVVMLLAGYPFLEPNPWMVLPPASAHLLEITVRFGALFALAVWGAVVALRRGDRLGRLWVAQLAAAHLIWAGYLILSLVQHAREKDEVFYWARILTAATAGIGAWDLTRRASAWLRLGPPVPARAAALIALVALPWSFPCWWDPSKMDVYFAGSIPPLADSIRIPTDYLRRSTDPRGVVAGDREWAKYVAALGARRVLITTALHVPPDYPDRVRLEEALVRDSRGAEVRAAASRFGVRYLLVTRDLLASYPGVRLEDIQRREHFRPLVHWASGQDYVALVELR